MKKGLSAILAIFFLTQTAPIAVNVSAEVYALNPTDRISEIPFQMNAGNLSVTCQILPDLNSLLKGCRIKPHESYSSPEAARSS